MQETSWSTTDRIKHILTTKSSLVFAVIIGIWEMLMIIQAFMIPDSIKYNDFDSTTVKLAKIAEAENNISTVSFFAVLSTILIFTAVYTAKKIHSGFVKKLLTVIFSFSVLMSVVFSNKNIVYIFLAVTFLPAMFFYILENGELNTFFQNRVVVFTIRRLGAIVPMFLTIAAFTFFSLNFLGNPVKLALAQLRQAREEKAAALKRRWGLVYPPNHPKAGDDIPVGERFLNWLNDFLHSDLGTGFFPPTDVSQDLGLRVWETVKMQLSALIFSFLLSVIIGILAAYYHKTIFDGLISSLALIGLSMPIFVSGILAILFFSGTGLGWFPGGKAHSEVYRFADSCVGGGPYDCRSRPDDFFFKYFETSYQDSNFWMSWLNLFFNFTWDSIMHLVLPVATLTFATMATFARLTRGEMLEVLIQDYITAARANGLSEFQIIRKHALKNVMLPLITFLGLSVGGILAGAPITETVFSYSAGLGNYFISRLNKFDYPRVMAITMIITLMTLISNLIVDVLYTYLDPRIEL